MKIFFEVECVAFNSKKFIKAETNEEVKYNEVAFLNTLDDGTKEVFILNTTAGSRAEWEGKKGVVEIDVDVKSDRKPRIVNFVVS